MPPRRFSPSPAKLCLFASVLLFIVLFWRLGSATFWDPDEAHYAQTSREMIERGDWLAPYYNGSPFFDKPALFHVLQASAMLALGPTELAARIVPALAALALVGLTAWAGASLVSLETGLVAALLLAMNPGLFGLSRYAILDTLFTAFTFGGAALLSVAAVRGRRALEWGGYALLALAVLVKGPLALVLCGLTLLVACVWSADARRRLLSLHWAMGLGLVIGLAAPWFLYMLARFGDAFVQGYVLDENLRLYGSSRFANQPGPLFYTQILLVGMLPWTGLLLGRLVDDLRASWRGGAPLDTVEVLLWSWVGAILVFFSGSTFKLDHYVFPTAPALCLLCARAWLEACADPASPRHAGARVGLRLIGPLLLLVGIGASIFVVARLELPRAAIAVPIAVASCGALLTAGRDGRGGASPAALWLTTVAMLAVYGGVVGFAMPALEARKVVPDVARWVAARAETERIAAYGLNRWAPAFRFYVSRPTTFLDDPLEAAAFVRAREPFYCVMTREGLAELETAGLALRVVYEREGLWATSGRALWRRQLPPAHFVVVTRGDSVVAAAD
ncbi:MAG: glycosyltransferase family 39 protein [Acidobacteria bacterium]|nr:glycosyltransferase family 39 protein [Acidobacteriota bacterium]